MEFVTYKQLVIFDKRKLCMDGVYYISRYTF